MNSKEWWEKRRERNRMLRALASDNPKKFEESVPELKEKIYKEIPR